jgi:hypothetical protein
MIAELTKQTLAEVAATYSGRIELANYFQSFLQICGGETSDLYRARRRNFRRGNDSRSRVAVA